MADSAIKQQLTEDMKTAMRAKDKPRLGVIRLALAAIKQREVDERIELNDTDVLAVIDKMVKQRRDSAQQFTDADRPELADQENFEMKEMGKVMGLLKPQVQGRADMGAVSQRIKALLGG
jgi:uncharacterized protein YqeY